MASEKKTPRLPPRLRRGDTIGIVAPASHFDRQSFARGIEVLESMGFQTYLPDLIYEKSGKRAGVDHRRAELVNRLFVDPKIQGIVCARGGYGSLRILELLDYVQIGRNPKIFVGFSDISAIHACLYQRCEMVTFHGPTITTLARSSLETQQSFSKALMTTTGISIAPLHPVTLRAGVGAGPVVGGNLTTLCHLLGTPFSPRFRGHILLLEDQGEAVYRIDRMLSQMKLAGCLDGITGLMLGMFKNCGPMQEIFEVIQDIFQDNNIPILAGFGIGHNEPNFTIPFGLNANLDTNQGRLSFHGRATRA